MKTCQESMAAKRFSEISVSILDFKKTFQNCLDLGVKVDINQIYLIEDVRSANVKSPRLER